MRLFDLTWLREQYPEIPWGEPVSITTARGTGYACRVCIANHGATGKDKPPFADEGDARQHIAAVHGP